ncbi:hypothetical protein CR513_36660, partial [Mucuna pruriens]
MRGRAPCQDEPMVISMGVAGYKVERVLIDQESSANILYRSTLEKMQLPAGMIQPCQGNLYGFTGECIPILGTMELEKCLGERPISRTILIQYTIVDALASYNIIVGQPALNKLGAIVSAKHLCMKFPVGRKVGSVWADTRVAQKCYEDSLRVETSLVENHERPGLGFGSKEPVRKRGTTPGRGAERDQVGTKARADDKDRDNHEPRRRRDARGGPQDMPSVDPNFMCHQLSVDKQAKPVAQKKRKIGEEKREAAKQETRKLISAGFVREVQYPTWLANVVMVRKANGKWRMCTDYTDLNKACPKDPYPLPSIDRLVDNVAGFTFLSFMDAYSGYNQIRMHPQDEEKTAFIIDEGAFCYQVMPFGLKNAGATYQRLMDKIFKGILGKDVEVYVDDMLRLNLVKCSFGVRAGKFLGFMLTERGIEANPEKCQAITNVRSPKSIKEVQQFMGKVTALARFISKSVEMSTPLFATLKKGGRFAWTDECEEAFLRLKAMMASPPVLTRPRPVLIQEEEGEQRPVYFTSKVLQGLEKRYQKIEKAALALVTASRRLRPYFQTFSVIVRTDLPIRQVLRKPDLARRMVVWSVQLSEFDISFERRGHIKAQVLADFVNELSPEDRPPVEEGEWYVSVDGSTNQSRSGAGVILEGPGGVLVEQSLHFDFRASNNQAEYEALLAGMRLARDLEAKILTAKMKLATCFEKFKLVHVPREQNERADLLAKLASTQRRGQLRSIIHENVESPTVDKEEVWNIEERETWMTPLIRYLRNGRMDESEEGAKKLSKEAAKYTLVGQRLYRRGYAFPLLKCLDSEEAEYTMREIHEGVCGTHIGGRALASKIARAGYYWPTLKNDCMSFVRKCDKCQRFAEGHKAPPEKLYAMVTPWAFCRWGVVM